MFPGSEDLSLTTRMCSIRTCETRRRIGCDSLDCDTRPVKARQSSFKPDKSYDFWAKEGGKDVQLGRQIKRWLQTGHNVPGAGCKTNYARMLIRKGRGG